MGRQSRAIPGSIRQSRFTFPLGAQDPLPAATRISGRTGSTGIRPPARPAQINTAGTSFEFTVTVTDKGTLSDTATITVNVTEVNDAPTTSGIADVKVNRNASPTTINLAASFADEEDEDSELVYTVQNNSNGSL